MRMCWNEWFRVIPHGIYIVIFACGPGRRIRRKMGKGRCGQILSHLLSYISGRIEREGDIRESS